MMATSFSPPRFPISLGPPRARRSRAGPAIAFVVHLLLLWLIVQVAPAVDFARSAGDRPGLAAGGGGGGGGRQVHLTALPPRVVPPQPVVPPPPPPPPVVPVPDPIVAEVVLEVPVVDSVLAAAPDSAGGSGAGAGSGAGTGRGPGSGSGEGGGSGSGRGRGTGAGSGPGDGGEGGRARPPEPRQLILPPAEVPGSVRGVTVAVTFDVGADGRVLDVHFAPELTDRGFARKLEGVMRGYRFRPARSPEGRAVAGRTTVTLTF